MGRRRECCLSLFIRLKDQVHAPVPHRNLLKEVEEEEELLGDEGVEEALVEAREKSLVVQIGHLREDIMQTQFLVHKNSREIRRMKRIM